jgi:glycosyltransferase involved in cell wall biosynthesis
VNSKNLSRFFIHATNIHQGGGRSLLSSLLSVANPFTVFLLDNRMVLPENILENLNILRVKPSIFKRLAAEYWLFKNVTDIDKVLCFGNLPPLFRLRGKTIVFIQNRFLVECVTLNHFSIKSRIRLTIERLWLNIRMMNVDEFIVQTPTMKRLLDIKTRGNVPVRVLPFVTKSNRYKNDNLRLNHHIGSSYNFLYVASGEQHKNHINLIEAWCLLAEDGLFPSLCLTLDEDFFVDLCGFIRYMKDRHGLHVFNAGLLSHDQTLSLYGKSDAIIYPSKFESFGLPLIEAMQAGLPVLASELDFVRDVLDPDQSFDPDSAHSIMRAVKRFLGSTKNPLELSDPTEFLNSVFT